MTPIELLAELTKANGGLERVNTVKLLVSFTQLWAQDPRVPEYLNGLRDGQKKVKRTGLTFLDDLLAAIASSSLLKANSFPKDRPKWYGKIPEDQTLQSWRDYFHPPPQSSQTGIKTGNRPRQRLRNHTLRHPHPRHHTFRHGGNGWESGRRRPCVLYGSA